MANQMNPNELNNKVKNYLEANDTNKNIIIF